MSLSIFLGDDLVHLVDVRIDATDEVVRRGPDRDRRLTDQHPHLRLQRQLVERGRQPAAGRVPHKAQASILQRCLCQVQHTCGIGLNVTSESKFFTRQHYRNAMIANRSADNDCITVVDIPHPQRTATAYAHARGSQKQATTRSPSLAGAAAVV